MHQVTLFLIQIFFPPLVQCLWHIILLIDLLDANLDVKSPAFIPPPFPLWWFWPSSLLLQLMKWGNPLWVTQEGGLQSCLNRFRDVIIQQVRLCIPELSSRTKYISAVSMCCCLSLWLREASVLVLWLQC